MPNQPTLPHQSDSSRCGASLGAAILVAVGLLPPALQADELIMRNGDRISGSAISRSGDTLRFQTSYAGVITVSWSEVKTLTTSEPMTVQVEHKRIVPTQRIENRETDMTITAAVDEEELVLEQAALTAINPEPWTLGEGYKFSGLINFAAKFERGNNVTDEIDADGNAEFRRLHHRARANFTLETDTKNGDSTKNKWKFRTSYDYFPANSWDIGIKVPKWYYGATVAAEADEFADLTLRLGMGPHVGYQFYEGHAMNLLTEIGIMHVREEFQNDPSDNYWAGAWLVDFDRFLFDGFTQFYHRQTGLQGIKGSGKFVWDSWTGFRVPLWSGIVASAELQIEYDSEPAPDVEKTDYTTRLKLGYEW